MENNMKTALILSVLFAASVASTASLAQNYVLYSSAFGNWHTTITAAPAAGHFTAIDMGRAGQRSRRMHDRSR
jgi:hypothetical protein